MASSSLVSIVVVNVPDAHGEYSDSWLQHPGAAAVVRRTAADKFSIPTHLQRPRLFISGAGTPAVLPPGWAHFDLRDTSMQDPVVAIRFVSSADVRIMYERLKTRHWMRQLLFRCLLVASGAALAMCWFN